MSKIHHVNDRSIEHTKTRDTMAHKLVTADAPDGLWSTRGFAVTKTQQPAVDVQPRHGGKAKGGVVAHSWGSTPQQIAQDGTRHLIEGAPDAASANPLDTLSASQYGKRLPIPAMHPAMKSGARHDDSIGSTFDPTMADKVMGDAVVSGATKLPATVKERDCK